MKDNKDLDSGLNKDGGKNDSSRITKFYFNIGGIIC